MLAPLSGKKLEWTARAVHPMRWEVRRPWWPPFCTVDAWPPQVLVWLTNDGSPLQRWSIQFDVTKYDGRIGDLPGAVGWTDTRHVDEGPPWTSGETRRFRLKVRGRDLPEPGNYAVRLHVAEFVHLPGQPGSYGGQEAFYGVIFERFRVHPNSDIRNSLVGLIALIGGAAGLVKVIL